MNKMFIRKQLSFGLNYNLMNPLLIVLNGASSAGKTQIARALLPMLPTPAIHTGLDDILEREKPFGVEGGSAFNKLQRTLRVIWFGMTDGRLQLFKKLHREAASHCQNRRSVIVETSLMDQRALLDAAQCFAPIGGWLVGVKPPLEISEHWEQGRADRPPGHARRHYDLVHVHNTYDLLLDSSIMTPHEMAVTLLQKVKSSTPHAFKQLIGERS
jgi:chloramphenicol 3-O phosphotransferase